MPISFAEAIARGLRTNLGLFTSQQSNEELRAQRLRALSSLLPQLNGQVGMTEQQINLQAFGFLVSFRRLGFQIPKIVGPYSYQSALLNATVPLFDYRSISNLRASRETQKASQLSVNNARDLVVQAVGNAYLQIIADAARIVFHPSRDRRRQRGLTINATAATTPAPPSVSMCSFAGGAEAAPATTSGR